MIFKCNFKKYTVLCLITSQFVSYFVLLCAKIHLNENKIIGYLNI